jgi:hypothetical protein
MGVGEPASVVAGLVLALALGGVVVEGAEFCRAALARLREDGGTVVAAVGRGGAAKIEPRGLDTDDLERVRVGVLC